MRDSLESMLVRVATKRKQPPRPPPLLIELFPTVGDQREESETFPFCYVIEERGKVPYYEVGRLLTEETTVALRGVVSRVSASLDPREVEPLEFGRLVEVLEQLAVEKLVSLGISNRTRELSELVAYEAVGLSRIYALSRDENVSEFFVDSEFAPLYLDHAQVGRCESAIVLTERERTSLVTHLDTFSGYTIDYRTPSMKNDMTIGGARLRVSLDLEPVSVSRFSLDVRRLNMAGLSLARLIQLRVLSLEAAATLVGWLESGGNVTIVGETGTGKTTLLNALDEQVERRLRRLYIEDAVETNDMLDRGYHQTKVKVDPFERGDGSGRTKESEIIKALHRSPDIVILSEVQSEEHSRAFFQALSSGARGMQTFHASSIEQALRRWTEMHHIPEQSLLDLGLMVQMHRPDRLGQERFVQRICQVTQERGVPRLKELFTRDRESNLRNVAGVGWPMPPDGVEMARLVHKTELAGQRISH